MLTAVQLQAMADVFSLQEGHAGNAAGFCMMSASLIVSWDPGRQEVWLTFLSCTAPRLNRTTLFTMMTEVMKTGNTKKTAHLQTASASVMQDQAHASNNHRVLSQASSDQLREA